MTLDRQYMKDKEDDELAAIDEHIRKMLVEFIDQICQDFSARRVPLDRDEAISIIEKFVTKRRRWL